MATLVRFLKHADGEVFAMFPQLNYNKRLYGNTMKIGYAHIGQHSACASDLYQEQSDLYKPATKEEYAPLLSELNQIGYTDLKVLNKK